MGGSVDTMLMARKQPDWGSAKGTRRAHVAKSYRVLLNVGDNFADFVDEFRGTEAERAEGPGRAQGSLGPRVDHAREPAPMARSSPRPFGHDFKLSDADRRKAKREALAGMAGALTAGSLPRHAGGPMDARPTMKVE